MPSPRSGTVTQDVAKVVREYKAGKVEFRNDSGGNVHAVVGKISFDAGQAAGKYPGFRGPDPGHEAQLGQGNFRAEHRDLCDDESLGAGGGVADAGKRGHHSNHRSG